MTEQEQHAHEKLDLEHAPLTPEDITDLSEIFSALGDPTRVRIIYAILEHERSVGEIAKLLGLSEPSVSQHLRRLRSLRIVRMRAEGRYRFYQLDDDHVATLLSICLEHIRCG
jgi:DNA-binding transcriptional ArsR family regulator